MKTNFGVQYYVYSFLERNWRSLTHYRNEVYIKALWAYDKELKSDLPLDPRLGTGPGGCLITV